MNSMSCHLRENLSEWCSRMRKRILFVESEKKCKLLGLLDGFGEWECEFDGRRYFRRHPDFFLDFDLVVATNYSSSISNLVCCKCLSVSVPTLFFSDGLYDLSNSLRNPLLSCNNRVLYGFLPFSYFATVSKVYVYGGSTNFINYIPGRMLTMKEPMNNNIKSKRILITTANNAYFSKNEFDRLVGLINDLSNYLLRKRIDFSFRIFDRAILDSLLHGDSVSNDIDGSFEDCLSRYSHVISTPSSVVITSMYHGRATAQLIYRSEPTSVSTAWNIPSIDIFDESFQGFINLQEDLMEYQMESISDNFDNVTSKDVVDKVFMDLSSHRASMNVSEFRDSEVERILNSSFNFNFEFFLRRIFEMSFLSRYFSIVKRFIRQ